MWPFRAKGHQLQTNLHCCFASRNLCIVRSAWLLSIHYDNGHALSQHYEVKFVNKHDLTNSFKAQNNCKFERSCGGITFNLYFKHGFHEVCEFKMFLFLTRKRDLVQMQIGEDYGPPPWTTIFKFIGCSLCFLKLSWWFILYHLYLKISYRIHILN